MGAAGDRGGGGRGRRSDVAAGGARTTDERAGVATVGAGDRQDLVEVDVADEPRDREATKALPATQPKIPKIDEHRFRLRGVRARQLAGRKTKTTQY